VLARTDSLILGWNEAISRTQELIRIGVDAVLIEALPDKDAMRKAVKEVGAPIFANIIEGGKTENLSAKDLGELGFCAVAYPWTLVAAKLKSIRETLENLKKSRTVGAPPTILSYSEVCEGVGFNKYWERKKNTSLRSSAKERQMGPTGRMGRMEQIDVCSNAIIVNSNRGWPCASSIFSSRELLMWLLQFRSRADSQSSGLAPSDGFMTKLAIS